LTCAYPGADQFNSIREALIAAWPTLRLPHRVHFACGRNSDEDRGTVHYLRDTAIQAGLDAPTLFMEDIVWDGSASSISIDASGAPASSCTRGNSCCAMHSAATLPRHRHVESSRHGTSCSPAKVCWPCCGSGAGVARLCSC